MNQSRGKPNIRLYGPGDESGCRVCVVDLQDAQRTRDARLRPGEIMADEYLAQMHERCRRANGAIFVAAQGRDIVGLVMVLAHVPYESLDEPPGAYALVAELVVREDYRGQGVGRDLLHVAETFAREQGAVELRIVVQSSNVAAQRLYVDDGFIPYVEILSRSLVD